MRRLFTAFLAAIFLQTFGSAAFAQADPGITAEVQPVPPQVTLNRPAGTASLALDSYASFFVPLFNGGGSTLNRVFFNATVVVSDTEPPVTVDSVFGLPAGASCLGTGTTSITCTFGSLAKGTGVNFYVVVRAPTAGPFIRLDYTAGGAEGNGGANACCNLTGNATTELVDPDTDPQFLVRTTSFVKPGGGVFFTGGGLAATATDPWLSFVSVPNTTLFLTTLQIEESSSNLPLASNLFTRETTDLVIPGTFASLKIILRRDGSTIAPSAKIANAKIYYDRGAAGPVAYPYEVLPCTDTSYGVLPQVGIPCINKRTEYKRSNSPDPTNDWVGDWEFEIFALDNGRYIN